MHYGADDEPAHPLLAAISCVLGALFGLAFGIAGFMLATAFAAMMKAALPLMPVIVFLALWALAVGVVVTAFARAFRRGRDLGARLFAACGLAATTMLFAGELTGTITFYPWKTTFYVVPGPITR